MTEHKIEPELNQPIPRKIAARDGCVLGCLYWLGSVVFLPHTLIGLFLASEAATGGIRHFRTWTSDTVVVGHVTSKSQSPGKGSRIYYTVHYAFAVNGNDHEGHISPSADDDAAIEVGQQFEVRVDEASPARGHWPDLPGYSPLRESMGLVIAALFWNGIVLLVWWLLIVRPWLRRRLVRYGRVATGFVREVKTVPGKANTEYRIRYEYAVETTGEPTRWLQGKASQTHPSEAADLRPGDRVTVLYDPKRPGRSLLYRLCYYKAV